MKRSKARALIRVAPGLNSQRVSGLGCIFGEASQAQASAVDQAMVEESNHRRVMQLVKALTYWLAGGL